MELTPYVDRLRSDLSDAAAAGGAEAQSAAERLALALDPATRMVLLEALGGGLGLGATGGCGIGEVAAEAVDVRRELHDVTVTSR